MKLRTLKDIINVLEAAVEDAAVAFERADDIEMVYEMQSYQYEVERLRQEDNNHE